MKATRRSILLGGTSALVTAWLGLPSAWSEESGLTPEQLNSLFLADAEPEPRGFVQRRPSPRWVDQFPRPEPVWQPRTLSIDHRHLAALSPQPDCVPFQLDAALLESLAALNAFHLVDQSEHVLFGLRGCSMIDSTPLDFVESIKVAEALPDHMNLRCVIGVWSKSDKKIWATTASTVPNVDYMYQMIKGGKRCNMLPTGLYQYVVGTHRKGSSYPQDGAFRQAQAVPVLRNSNNLSFELPPTDRFDVTIDLIVFDNIHAGILESQPKPPFFSSAGCQVIPGGYSSRESTPYGMWAAFRERAGLAPIPKDEDNGRKFTYMLLTGVDARLVAEGRAESLGSRMRFGSSGERVKEVRHALGCAPGQVIDQRAMIAYLKWQMREYGYSDGVVSTEDVARLLA